MKQPVRVLIVDDQSSARLGLRALLAFFPEIEIVGEASNGQQAILASAALQPDVILMDVQMPLMDGLEATRQIKQSQPQVKVIVLTIYRTSHHAATTIGVDDFLLKGGGVEELRSAILRAVS